MSTVTTQPLTMTELAQAIEAEEVPSTEVERAADYLGVDPAELQNVNGEAVIIPESMQVIIDGLNAPTEDGKQLTAQPLTEDERAELSPRISDPAPDEYDPFDDGSNPIDDERETPRFTPLPECSHTPGPWRVRNPAYEQCESPDYIGIKSVKFPYYSTNREQNWRGFNLSGFISNADARLMASAPDLLGALQDLCQQLESCDFRDDIGRRAINLKAYRDARLLILKTLGVPDAIFEGEAA